MIAYLSNFVGKDKSMTQKFVVPWQGQLEIDFRTNGIFPEVFITKFWLLKCSFGECSLLLHKTGLSSARYRMDNINWQCRNTQISQASTNRKQRSQTKMATRKISVLLGKSIF